MKKLHTLLLALVAAITTAAQQPTGFSYQAALRNSSGQVLANQSVTLRLSLTNASGTTTYYSESHALQTTAQGVVSLTVGGGTVVSGTYSAVPWQGQEVRLRVEVSTDGGATYTDMGSQPLQAVPYALVAGNAMEWLGSLSSPPPSPQINQAYHNTTDSTSYIWDGTAWQVLAQRGARGEPGPQGVQGEVGPQGVPGANGLSVQWLGSFPVEPPDPTLNQAYHNTTDSVSYIWDGTAWQVLAQRGARGELGPRGVQGEVGPQGPQGVQGEVGPEGPRGPAGVGLTLRGNWSADSTYTEGDYVFDESSSTPGVNSMWICQNPVGPTANHPKDDTASWVEFEAPEGPQGPPGPEGPLVPGTSGQTLRHDGTSWVANSFLFNSGSQVGIGTTTPNSILTVKSLTTNNQIAKFADDARYIGIGRDEVGSYDLSGNLASLYFNHGALTLTASGNVGVGTSTPGMKLDIVGSLRSSGELISTNSNQARFIAGNYGLIHRNDGTNYYMLLTNSGDQYGSWNTLRPFNIANTSGNVNIGNSALFVQHGGNVGIGTTSPTAKLDVNGTAKVSTLIPGWIEVNQLGTGNRYAGIDFHGDDTYTDYALRIVRGNSGPNSISNIMHRGTGSLQIVTQEASKITFYTNNSFRMTIAETGNVGIGEINPTARLSLKGVTDNDTLFSVKDRLGRNVFIVYPDAVQVIVPTDTKSNQRGAFVVSGRGTSKANVNFVNLKKDNYFIGHNVAPNVTTGVGNAIMGYEAGQSLTTGSNNIFLGFNAGKANDTGWNNSFFGNNAGVANKGGNYNVFLGNQAGLSNTTGSSNIFIGINAGQANTTGYSNVFIGPTSGYSNTTGYNNTFLGDNAGSSLVGNGNICIGYNSGPPSSTSASNRLYIDNGSGSETSSFIYGDMTLGSKKLRFNTSVGIFSTPGASHAFRVNGYVYIQSGNLGVNVDPTANYGLQVNGGTSAYYSIYAYKGGYTPGSWTSGSDLRLKKEIVPLNNTLEFINSIRAVYYFWRCDEFENRQLSQRKQIGLIAQDVERVYPELVSEDEEGYKAIAYDKFTAVLLSAIQEQQQIIINQRNELISLKAEIGGIKEQQKQLNDKEREIEELKARLDAIEKLLMLQAK